MVVAVVSCLLLGRWQLDRHEVTHSLQNMAYALQWPMFALFFAVMWWRMLHLESRRLDEEADEFDADSEPAAQPDPDAAQPASAQPEDAQPAAAQPAPAQRDATAVPTSAPSAPPADDEDDDPALAAYNRMLAALAARDRETARRR